LSSSNLLLDSLFGKAVLQKREEKMTVLVAWS